MVITHIFFNKNCSANSVAIQSDGKIVVAGYVDTLNVVQLGLSPRYLVIRYNTDGSIDSTFGNSGFYISSSTFEGKLSNIIIQPDGKIIASGKDLNYHLVFMRILPNGTLDNTFGVNGMSIVSITGIASSTSDLKLQSNGKINSNCLF